MAKAKEEVVSEHSTSVDITGTTAIVITDEASVIKVLSGIKAAKQTEMTHGSVQFELPRGYIHFGGRANGTGAKKVSNMSDENRMAAGQRLRNARAAKFGITGDQLMSLHLRPGVAPTSEQIASFQTKSSAKKADDFMKQARKGGSEAAAARQAAEADMAKEAKPRTRKVPTGTNPNPKQ